jgi:multidrug efflux pump subunit AcrB
VLALAAASVIGVMVLQFRSFVEPLVILLAAPLSFAGALALLLLTGTPLNVSSFMGLILLVGLIVKNGIILAGLHPASACARTVSCSRRRSATPPASVCVRS